MSLKLYCSGKVRDVFEVDTTKLLIVATDRISCFDYVLPTTIPDKGKILTQVSIFWFEYLRDIIDNHLISADLTNPELARFITEEDVDALKNRIMLVKKARRIDIECVVRGYISGSAWKEYQTGQTVCGMKLPAGLKESDRLPKPIFTPATKAESGHDMNISYEQTVDIVGSDVAKFLKEKSIQLYKKATEYAEQQGIIIADTKFEFGFVNLLSLSGEKESKQRKSHLSKIILIDEVCTPDSSRFWDKEKYQPGRPQESFDKQFARNYLEAIDWDKKTPVPALPSEIVEKTRQKYIEAYRRITKKHDI